MTASPQWWVISGEREGKYKVSFMWELQQCALTAVHAPWLWECVCAFLQQQLWDQCVQNLRTGPLSIPETQKDRNLKGLAPAWTLSDEKAEKRGWIGHRGINNWTYYSAGPCVICPIISSVKSEHSQTETLQGQTGVASQVVTFPFLSLRW